MDSVRAWGDSGAIGHTRPSHSGLMASPMSRRAMDYCVGLRADPPAPRQGTRQPPGGRRTGSPGASSATGVNRARNGHESAGCPRARMHLNPCRSRRQLGPRICPRHLGPCGSRTGGGLPSPGGPHASHLGPEADPGSGLRRYNQDVAAGSDETRSRSHEKSAVGLSTIRFLLFSAAPMDTDQVCPSAPNHAQGIPSLQTPNRRMEGKGGPYGARMVPRRTPSGRLSSGGLRRKPTRCPNHMTPCPEPAVTAEAQ